MKKLSRTFGLVLGMGLVGGTAFAAAQNHHCVKDGTPMPDKTHKECTKEGGKWEKDAPAKAADAKAADAKADAKPAAAKEPAKAAEAKPADAKAAAPAAK